MRERDSPGRCYRVESLEPRLLLAGDWLGGLAPAWTNDVSADAQHGDLSTFLIDGPGPDTRPDVLATLPGALDLGALVALGDDTVPADSTVSAASGTRHELVIIDSGIDGYEALVADIESRGHGLVRYDVFVLHSGTDGVQTLSDILAGYQGLDAVHLVSHGTDGAVQLGDTSLDASNVEDYAQALRGWAHALDSDADLLVYGCDLAAGESGRALLTTLGTLTQADVAASEDATGLALLGGDWDLEYAQGEINSTIAFGTHVQDNWAGLLAVFTVNTDNDTVDANPGDGFALDALGNTSLRAAIMEANALFGADTIMLPGGDYVLTLGGFDEDAGASGDLDIRQDLTIVGAGAQTTVIDGNSLDRVIEVHSVSAPDVSISGVTITGGDTTAATDSSGGGIRLRNGGSLVVTDVVVSNNNAFGIDGFGGGISAQGNLELVNVELADNKAEVRGGGLHLAFAPIAVTLTNVTISGNSTDEGGGVYAQLSPTLTNVTIADNTAFVRGGGIFAVSGNEPILTNSLVANNTSPLGPDIDGRVVSSGDNLVFDTRDTNGLQPGDIQGLAPLLGALSDNGGGTRTHALLSGSPAVNANTVLAAPTMDQRGFLRDSLPDIGAYEYGAVGVTDTGMAIWAEVGSTTPQYSLWDGSSFGAEGVSAPVNEYVTMQAAEAPTRDEVIVVGVNPGKKLSGEIWNGTSWAALPFNDFATVSAAFPQGTDVAYESVSGDAMVVWNNGTDISYRLWDGATWTAEATAALPLPGEPKVVMLTASPLTDEIIMYVTNTADQDYVLVWDGSAWVDSLVLATTADNGNDVWVAYEARSGNAMIVYAENSLDLRYRIWDGSAWSAEAVLNAPAGVAGNIGWTKIDADPNTDRLALAVYTHNSEVWLAVWDGSAAWDTQLATTTAPSNGTFSNVDVAFEAVTGEVLAVYAETTAPSNELRFRVWDGSWSAQMAGPDIGALANTLLLEAAPNTNGVMLAVQNDNSELNYVLWDGAAWGTPNLLEADSGEIENEPFAFVWNQSSGGVNGPPVANDDSYDVDLDTTLVVDAASGLLSNDTDPNFDPLTVYLLSGPSSGTLTLNPIGLTSLENLSLTPGNDTFPDWSPDSSQLAFASARDGDFEIYVINADGTGLMQVTSTGSSEQQPVWSPDGSQILYRSDADGTFDIYVMNADGSNPVRLTTGAAADGADELDASWSPDGTQIVYVMNNGAQTIYVMDADGSNVQPLTTPAAEDFAPAWSPDGTRIVFVSDRAANNEIYVMDADGSNVTRLTTNAAIDGAPSWSPDGSKILFHSDMDGDLELFVMDADGSNLVQLTDNLVNDRRAVWSPDGTRIAFETDRDGFYEVYVASVISDGGFSYTPNSGFTGVDSFTYQVTDGIDKSNSATVTLTVAANSAPTATNLSQAIGYLEDAASVALADIVVSDSDAGDTITATLTLADVTAGILSAGSGNGEMYTAGSGIWTITGTVAQVNAALADIAFIPTADRSVNTTITTHIEDLAGAGPLDGVITLSGTAVNDAPSFSMLGDQNVLEDSGPQSVAGFATALPGGGADESGQLFSYNVSSDNPGLFLVGPAIDASGTLTYTLNANMSGTARVTVSVSDDGGTANGGVDTAPDQTFDINVAAVSGTGGVDTTVTSPTDSTTENTDLVFSAANGNAIAVDDGTSNDTILRTTLTVTNGVLTLASTAGLTSVAGDGTNSVILIGTETAINAALDGLTFSPTASFTGSANLQITTDLQADLLGYYNFTQTDPLGLDSSPVGGNDATPSGPGSFPDPGVIFDVDRNSDVLVLDGVDDNLVIAGRFGTPTNVTLAAWVYVAASNEQEVISVGGSIALRLNDVNNGTGVTGFFNDGTGWNHTDTGQFIGGDGWRHVAFTFDDSNNTQVIYIDGVALGTTSFAGSINWAHQPNTTIGSHANGSSYFLDGMLDDVRIYERALSASEIQAMASDRFSDTEVISITVQVDNSAPVLADDSPSLTAINEDDVSSSGDSVAAIIVDGSISDPDGAAVESIAITAVDDSMGTWQYSTDDGASWNDVDDGSLGVDHALLLDGTLVGADTQRLRFVPNADFSGSPVITFRAWDMSVGVAGNYADTTVAGGTSAFSTATDTAGIDVNAVNDAPSFSTLGNQTVLEDAGAQTVAGFATALPGGGADESSQTFTYTVSSDNPGLFLVGPAIDASGTLTYTLNSNVNGTARVTVSVTDTGGTANGGVDTAPDQTFDIIVGAVNDAPSFNMLGDQTVLEDAGAQTVAGFATALPGGGADESGQTFTYTVSSDNPGLFLVGPAIDASGTLTYTLNSNVNGTARVTVSVTDTGGTANGGVDTAPDQTFDIIVGAVNDAPSFSILGDQAVLEDAGAQTVAGFATALPGGGADESGQTFTYTVSSDNPGLFLVGPAIDASGTLTYTLNSNVNGTARVTVSVTDTGGTANGGVDTSPDQTFDIIVGAVNDAPSFNMLGDQTVLEDAGAQTVAGFASALPGGGADESGQTFTYTVSSDNPGLFLVGPAIDASGTLTYTLNSNVNGTARVTVSVTDTGGTANGGVDTAPDQTFDIIVGAVNDAPSFSILGDQAVLEDAGAQTVAGFATALPGGGADESGQTFSYTVSSDNPGLFLVGPAIDASGTLTYTLNSNVNGTARVTVSVTDTGGTANGGVDTSPDQTFDIIVGAVNDAPSFNMLGDQTVLEDAGAQTVAGFASALPGGGADESGQTFTYTVSSDNPGLFLVGPAIDASGTLTYTLNSNVNGTARVTVSVTDTGGTANGGVDTAPDQTFDIIVGAVNDAPSFSILGDQAVLEDAGAQTVAGFATALPGGGADESGQTFSYTVSSDNPGLFLVGPAIDASGTLTYTLNSNVNGTARVTVSVTDTGGTANGGVDTSADQTFAITVIPVDEAVTATGLTQSHLYVEDSGPVALHDILVNVAGGNNLITATLTLSDTLTGSLSANSGNGETYSSDTGQWTVTGTVAQVNAALDAVQFLPIADNDVNSTVLTQVRNADGLGPADGQITLSVTPVNDAPQGDDSMVLLTGDSVYVLSMANFGFSDPVEGDLARSVQITSLPTWAGSLMLDDQIVTVGDSVSASDIEAGRLRFVPLYGIDGTLFGTLAFQVQDDGGTAAGGIDVDPSENYLTLVVTQASEGTVRTPVDVAPTAGPQQSSEATPPQAQADDSVVEETVNEPGASADSEPAADAGSPDAQAAPEPVDIPTVDILNAAQTQVIGIDVFPQQTVAVDAPTDEPAVAVNDKQAPVLERQFAAYEPLMTESQDIQLGLDQMRDALAQDIATSTFTLGGTAVSALGLSVGYVSWLLRGGVLLGSVVSSLPVWTFIDPLPVFARDNDEHDEDGDDQSLAAIVRSGAAANERANVPTDDKAPSSELSQSGAPDTHTDNR